MASGTRDDIIKDALVDWLRWPSKQAIKDHNLSRISQGLEPLPVTQQEFADKYGVTRETINRWANSDEIRQRVIDDFRAAISASDLEAIRISMIERAKGGNVPAAQLVYKLAGVLNQDAKQPPTAPPVDPAKLSSSSSKDLEARLRELEEE